MPPLVYDKKTHLYDVNGDLLSEVKIDIVPGAVHLLYFGELEGNQILKLDDGREIVLKGFEQNKKNPSKHIVYAAI